MYIFKIDYIGKTIVCIAGGCSLTAEQVNLASRFPTIAINDAYKLAPHANILYACDVRWWEWHGGVHGFKGLKVTHEYEKRHSDAGTIRPPYPGIPVVLSTGEKGYEPRQGYIKHGGNSGYQALHIAMDARPKNIILLGYDMHNKSGDQHWFGKHPSPYDSPLDTRFKRWLECFDTLVEPAKKMGIRIINCSPGSALTCFENMEVEECLRQI